MKKSPVTVYKTLSGKYKTVSNKIDSFMNYGSARLVKGDSFIEIDAPHLSLSMEVRYLTKAFMAPTTRHPAKKVPKSSAKKLMRCNSAKVFDRGRNHNGPVKGNVGAPSAFVMEVVTPAEFCGSQFYSSSSKPGVRLQPDDRRGDVCCGLVGGSISCLRSVSGRFRLIPAC